jgi:hypothetical protein
MDGITRQSPRQRGYGSTSSLRNDSLKHTRKHKKGGEESNQEAKLSALGGLSGQAGQTVRKGRADSPARCRGQSAGDTRTVRPGPTDRPLKRTEPTEPTREKRTVREDRADRPRGFWTVRYRSSDRPQTGCNENQKQNRIKTKRNKNTKNIRRTGTAPTVRRPHAERPRGADRAENARPRKSTPPIHHPISQAVEAIEIRVWGHEKHQPRMLYPKNLAS